MAKYLGYRTFCKEKMWDNTCSTFCATLLTPLGMRFSPCPTVFYVQIVSLTFEKLYEDMAYVSLEYFDSTQTNQNLQHLFRTHCTVSNNWMYLTFTCIFMYLFTLNKVLKIAIRFIFELRIYCVPHGWQNSSGSFKNFLRIFPTPLGSTMCTCKPRDLWWRILKPTDYHRLHVSTLALHFEAWAANSKTWNRGSYGAAWTTVVPQCYSFASLKFLR